MLELGETDWFLLVRVCDRTFLLYCYKYFNYC